MLTVPAGTMYLLCPILLLLLLLYSNRSVAVMGYDSIIADTIPQTATSKHNRISIPVLKTERNLFDFNSLKKRIKQPDSSGILGVVKKKSILKKDTSYKNLKQALKQRNQFFQFTGGYISYDMQYRSNIDTPFQEKNIMQHQVNGSVGVQLAERFPLRVNFFIRQSNSKLYRDIADVQLMADLPLLKKGMEQKFKKQLAIINGQQYDSLLERSLQLNTLEKGRLSNWLQTPQFRQLYTDYKDYLYQSVQRLNDSLQNRKDSSLQERLTAAQDFVARYDSVVARYQRFNRLTDSLEQAFNEMKRRIRKTEALLNGGWDQPENFKRVKDSVMKYTGQQLSTLQRREWMYHLKALSIGRAPVNYSELTSKNLTVNGINVEYNSWYYVAVTAGMVDYRFRDFIINRFNRLPQYMSLIRFGIGAINKNHFIVSYFNGRKQLYRSEAGSNGQSGVIPVQGYTVETRLAISRNAWLIGEAGESISPNTRVNPYLRTKAFQWSDKTNKALSLVFAARLGKWQGNFEAKYKYLGANYQSFSSFQNNSTIKFWSVKYDQAFFKRQLKLNLSVRKNDFSNPFLTQTYQSNNIVKTAVLVFRKRHWPTLTFGYIPIVQTTILDGLVTQYQYQSLTGSITHPYKLGQRRAVSSITVNRFYNRGVDTQFNYANSLAIVSSHEFYFSRFNSGFSIHHTRSERFRLTVMEQHLQFSPIKKMQVQLGVKISNLYQMETRTGYSFSTQLPISGQEYISIGFEQAYFMGVQNQLVRSGLGSIQLTKQF